MSVVEQKYLVAVKITPCNRLYYYESEEPLVVGQQVVVETMFGIRVGRVMALVSEEDLPEGIEITPVIRKATQEDLRQEQDNRALEEEAFQFCLERIKARALPMKLVRTEVMLDRRRIVFYFTAEGRVDFRELVRDLAAKFRTRIEMRQIGVRDEAKMLGGLGVCGRVTCCTQFLQCFAPISIKMAKEQELVLNTSKLTGLCGRLMCCLSYEYEGTIEGEDELPIETEDGTICEECYENTSRWKVAEGPQEPEEDLPQERTSEETAPEFELEARQLLESGPEQVETSLEESDSVTLQEDPSEDQQQQLDPHGPQEARQPQKQHHHKKDRHHKQKARRKRHKRKKKKRR